MSKLLDALKWKNIINNNDINSFWKVLEYLENKSSKWIIVISKNKKIYISELNIKKINNDTELNWIKYNWAVIDDSVNYDNLTDEQKNLLNKLK